MEKKQKDAGQATCCNKARRARRWHLRPQQTPRAAGCPAAVPDAPARNARRGQLAAPPRAAGIHSWAQLDLVNMDVELDLWGQRYCKSNVEKLSLTAAKGSCSTKGALQDHTCA